MISLVIMGALTLICVLLLLFRPFYIKRQTGQFQRRELNAAIYKDELAKLELDRQNQTISEAEYQSSSTELRARLLSDVDDAEEQTLTSSSPTKLIAILGASISTVAILLYLTFGGVGDILNADNQGRMDPEVQKMVDGLAKRLEADPTNYKGWAMLAKSYKVMRKPVEAERAYEKAMPLIEKDPQALAEYADTAASNANGDFSGKPDQLIQMALKVDPNHVMSLWLAGSSAFNRNDFDQAIKYWERLAKFIPADTDDGRSILGSINEARAKLGQPPIDQVKGALKQSPKEATSNAKISGVINLDPSLKGKVGEKDTLMVIVRGPGSRMPVAVLRVPAKFPYSFTVDDSNAMSPEFKLSGLKTVSIEARVSKSGQAQAEPGDLIGEVNAVNTTQSNVAIKINQVR